MSTTSLSLLDRAARNDDPDSWSRFMTIYRPLLTQWLRRFQVQEADAEDLIQEVMAVVARELPEFRHNHRKGAFRRWLRVTLINRLRDFWRQTKYHPAAGGGTSIQRQLNDLADETSSLSQQWNQEHDELVMQRLLETVQAKFQPTTWKAFQLQAIVGRSPKEVANELNMSMNSVYLAKSHVLNALRQEAEGLVDG